MNFTPYHTYEGLEVQARALWALVQSKEQELGLLRSRDYSLSEKKLAALEAALESERRANEVLTKEVERCWELMGIYLSVE